MPAFGFGSKSQPAIKDRSIEEQVLLALCVTGFLGIFPFAIYRLMNAQWILGIIDSTLLVGVFFIGSYVWVTRDLRLPSIILTFFYMSGMVAVIHIHGSALIHWAYPTMLAAYFLIRPQEAAVVNSLAMLALMPILVGLEDIEGLTVLVTLLLNNLFAYIFAKRMRLHTVKLTEEATKDFLTGIDNRKLYNRKVRESLAWHHRKGQASTLILIDIDNFKQVNDRFGHAKGDELLVNLVTIINQRLRVTDQLYRLGGEEFAILLPETKLVFASFMAEELRQLVEKSGLIADYPVTISLGVSESQIDDVELEWFNRADKALYQAKASGKNRVAVDQGDNSDQAISDCLPDY